MQLVAIELQRPMPQLLLEEFKYKFLSEGWNYKVVTRVAERFASEIESEDDYMYYISKSGNKWNHPFIKGKVGVCKCAICGERLCKHYRVMNGRRSLSVDVEDVNKKGKVFTREFSEQHSMRSSDNHEHDAYEMKKVYKVVIEKEKPKCLICEKQKNENDNVIGECDKEEEEEKGKEEQHSSFIVEDANKNKNNNGDNNDELFNTLNMGLPRHDPFDIEHPQSNVEEFVKMKLLSLLMGSRPASPDTIITMKQCEHTICDVCLEKHLKAQIESEALLLTCPYEDCDTEIDILRIIELTQSGLLRKSLWQYHRDKLISSNPNQYIHCTFNDCNGYINMTTEDEDNNSNTNSNRDNNPLSEEPLIDAQNSSLKQTRPPKYIHCISLSQSNLHVVHGLHTVCYYCRLTHDTSTSCEEYFDATLDSSRIRACPQCGDKYELDDIECNYYKCLRCHYEFCGECMQQLTHSHYYFSNEPGRCRKTKHEVPSSLVSKIIFWILFVLICLCFPVTLLLFLKEKVLYDEFTVQFNFTRRPLYVKYRILKILTDITLILVYNIRAYVFVFPVIVASPLVIIFFVSRECIF